ncbi:MAG: diguanylate cyclase [Gammaproteobacteria bacterium]|nr:diguanylate cyclase [Gammaproteobacteria bacterium]
MIPEESLKLYKSITRRYLLAVIILALLSSGAYYALQSAISDSESTAYIVNLSGRQRMLSQHIALDAHRLYKQKFIMFDEATELSQLMARHISDIDKANRQLSSGLLSENIKVDLSTEIRNMYFGTMGLSNRVNNYVALAYNILKSNDKDTVKELIENIDLVSEQLLKDLNKVVNQYQKEGEARLKQIVRLELFVWLTTLFALLFEILFIFRPMGKEVVESKKSEENVLSNLQDLVELRTLKLEQANEQLEQLAHHDSLTGLRNRLTMEYDIDSLIHVYQEHHIPLAVAMIDIDWFKKVNDTYGHQAGDFVLKELAGLFTRIIRDSDQIYRVGGEEFVLILNRIEKDETIIKLEEIRNQVLLHDFKFKDKLISLTISIGVYHTSLYPLDQVHDIIQAADSALYESKRNGRNCISLAQS